MAEEMKKRGRKGTKVVKVKEMLLNGETDIAKIATKSGAKESTVFAQRYALYKSGKLKKPAKVAKPAKLTKSAPAKKADK
ncbi:hypothetical protein KKG81_04845 [bacterium]|nr:hypothetical protein [bacterium]